MKLVGVIGTAVLSLSLGAAVPGYAQQDQHDQQEDKNDKPAQEKEKKAQPEKSVKPEEKNSQQPEKMAKPEERNTQQREQSVKPEERNAQQPEKNARPEERNAQQAQPERQEQRGGGGRIPEQRYQANFGREHSFRVSQGDYSNHRFEYGGYSFAFVDAWPSNWLYTQDVFVVEINGMYFLCNPMYPGVNVAISVMP